MKPEEVNTEQRLTPAKQSGVEPDCAATSGSATSGSAPSDTEMLNWLAQRCYLPGDHPDDGILVVVSEKYAPLGEFTLNAKNDNAALRRAIRRAMSEPNDCVSDGANNPKP